MMTKKLLLTLLIIMIYSVSYAQPVAPTNLTASIEKWFGLKYVLLKLRLSVHIYRLVESLLYLIFSF